MAVLATMRSIELGNIKNALTYQSTHDVDCLALILEAIFLGVACPATSASIVETIGPAPAVWLFYSFVLFLSSGINWRCV